MDFEITRVDCILFMMISCVEIGQQKIKHVIHSTRMCMTRRLSFDLREHT